MEPAVTPKRHTLRITFTETPQDQALYEALKRSSEREHRLQLPRQARYLLAMALGLREADLFMLIRIGVCSEDPYDPSEKAAKAVAVKKKTNLHLV